MDDDLIFKIILVIVFVIIAIISINLVIYFEYYKHNSTCLEKKAEILCEEMNQKLERIEVISSDFYCKEDERKDRIDRYNFLRYEMEECRN